MMPQTDLAAGPTAPRSYTASEAQLAGLVPTGHVWDEGQQRPVPRGSVAVDRPAVEDTGLSAEDFRRRQVDILRFVKHQLEPAVLADDRKILKVNDYYVVPGTAKPALSKRGAEKLAKNYRLDVLRSEIVASDRQPDYVFARAVVELARAGRVVSSRTGSASSAEKQFQRGVKKYTLGEGANAKVDLRGAINDIEAKAQKRAMVQAVIFAVGATDILEVAEEWQDDGEIPEGEAEVLAEPVPGDDPEKMLLTKLAHPTFTDEDRAATRAWLKKKARTPEQLQQQLAAAEDRIVRWEEQREAGVLG